ncbi:hypothetical protein LX64_00872 [Chitinophaga skermanii]|uniref:Zinc ribbon family protein n=1 Tax=Chitinophaga skermanii TaxID=331697 RepID=A0A327QWA2_9BACT|nr:hypothetical protein [Chitinophaga skermanii]RAJ08225.1 hypothetical protein LX64_00872 [Chitinophaga skermanii]
MFIVYGKKVGVIKRSTDHQRNCKNCKDFNQKTVVRQAYGHVYYIPFFPMGPKYAEIYCESCGQRTHDTTLQNDYEKSTRAPFYYYSGLIVILSLMLYGAIADWMDSFSTKKFVQHPIVNDVYRVVDKQENGDVYTYLKLKKIEGDSLSFYESRLVYVHVSKKFAEIDYFMNNAFVKYSKNQIVNMFDEGLIDQIERDYTEASGYSREETMKE